MSRAPDHPQAAPGAVAGVPRLRAVASAAAGSAAMSYLLAVVVAAVAGLTAAQGPAPLALLVAGVPLWLAAHQVPLSLDGAPLGVLPLLPTLGVAALTARFAGTAIERLGGRWGGAAAWVVCGLAGTHASVAVLTTALPLGPTRAEPWSALLGAGLVTAAGAAVGVLRAAGAPGWWWRAANSLNTGLIAAAVGAAALATAGALMLFAALAVSASTVQAGFLMRPGLGAGLGVTVLAVCYLPNALVAAIGWLAGPGVTVGAAAATPTAVSAGPLPPLPVLAAMPTGQPPGWAVVVFAFPVAAGALVGLACRRSGRDPVTRLRSVAVATLTIAVGWAVFAWVVSGRLGGGPFDPVELPALSGALALLGWIGVPAMVTVVVPRGPWFGRRRRLGWTAADYQGPGASGAEPSPEGYSQDEHPPAYSPEGLVAPFAPEGHEPPGEDEPFPDGDEPWAADEYAAADQPPADADGTSVADQQTPRSPS